MPTPQQILKKYWGFDAFRPLQEDIINDVLKGKDTLALLPTGGGKTICFQVPALVKQGICIVISPLVALMNDQVEGLKKKGIKAVALTGGIPKRKIDILLDNCIYGNIKFLYVSPERLKQRLFIERFKQMKINLIAIDEAHCISQWGYDFRPPYLEIKKLREHHPDVPFLALTATATREVVSDIQKQLAFKKTNVLKKSFFRPNLQYVVLNENDGYTALLRVLKNVKGSSIVYTRSRRETIEIAQFLKHQNITSTFYHAGLTHEERNQKQQLWIANKIQTIVSTNAFGMGIDKPDVRVVVNYGIPDSLEAYFQEAGRAGRDEKRAYAVLITKPDNAELLQRQLELKFPPRETIKKAYYAICNYLRIAIGAGEDFQAPIDFEKVATQFNISLSSLIYSFPFLERAGYFSLYAPIGTRSTVKILLQGQALYDFQVRHHDFDLVLKVLLRSYGGMFEEPVKIKEKDLAKRIGKSVDFITKTLQKLHHLEVLEYTKHTHLPTLTFLQPRIDIKYLRIPKIIYEHRKALAQQKLNKAIDYAYQSEECRSVKLLHYFDDFSAKQCGKCDVCLARKYDNNLSGKEFEHIAQTIKQYIKQHPDCTYNELLNNIKANREQVKFVLKWLSDNEEINLK